MHAATIALAASLAFAAAEPPTTLPAAPPAVAPGTAPATGPASRPADWQRDEPRMKQLAARLAAGGARFLLATQEQSGGWVSDTGPGITCLVLKALAQQPDFPPRHPAIERGVGFVLTFQREDGGIYASEGLLKNYESAVALSMFAALRDPLRQTQVEKLQACLKLLQWDEGENISRDNVWYGGAGYGRGERPDLSNTQMMLEALRDSGLAQDDPAYKKALIFIQRCQMLAETNDQPYAKGSAQGGFIYSPAGGGESKAGELEVGGRKELRSYGSMTYAGFKSLLHAGVTRDDPRVRAACDWIRGHWSLDYNPNMPEKQSFEGLYYYYHVFARALDAWGEPVIIETNGRPRVWRHELLSRLETMQHSDGSWTNEADRWMEGWAQLTTAYALLAIQAAYPQR
jgi:squalene-hopene/tetraprenyl-beta-curcumene cyclase